MGAAPPRTKCAHFLGILCSSPPPPQYHMRIHREERKYLCPDCGYKCKWVNQLKYHMTKHTGESVVSMGPWGPPHSWHAQSPSGGGCPYSDSGCTLRGGGEVDGPE